MVTTAWSGAHDADIVAVLLDAKREISTGDAAMLEKLADIRKPKVLILNKVDTVEKPPLLDLAARANAAAKFDATFMLSALRGDGVADLRLWLAAHVPAGPWLYPEDQIADAPSRALAAEITREKLFLRLHQELRYIHVPYKGTSELTLAVESGQVMAGVNSIGLRAGGRCGPPAAARDLRGAALAALAAGADPARTGLRHRGDVALRAGRPARIAA